MGIPALLVFRDGRVRAITVQDPPPVRDCICDEPYREPPCATVFRSSGAHECGRAARMQSRDDRRRLAEVQRRGPHGYITNVANRRTAAKGGSNTGNGPLAFATRASESKKRTPGNWAQMSYYTVA